jgi:hypothetical protein
MRSRSGFYRERDGSERLWYSPTDIEVMMEDALRASGLLPTEDSPAVNIERFIQSLDVRMDQYANLDATVLGVTEFYTNKSPKILINRNLTGAIDDDNTPPGIRGRWRATMAHEASHVVMHRLLFEVNQGQQGLFTTESQTGSRQLMRCLKKNVLFRGGGTNDWREVQANMGMAALLMPKRLFRQIAGRTMDALQIPANALSTGSDAAATLSAEIAALLDVSKQAAGIRLETLGFVSPARQSWLIHADLSS